MDVRHDLDQTAFAPYLSCSSLAAICGARRPR
jgi:hypothetical protein